MEFQIEFECNNTPCRADLVEGKGAGPTVCINGKEFTVIAKDNGKLQIAKIFPKIRNIECASVGELVGKIGTIPGCSSVSVVGRSNQVGVQTLGGPQAAVTGSWMQQEKSTLPAFRTQVAEAYWDKYVDKTNNQSVKDHSQIKVAIARGTSDPEQILADFDAAVSSPDGKEYFCSLFQHLEFYQLYPVVNGEQLDIELPTVKPGKVDLAIPGLECDIQTYLNDRGFSGVVALSDGQNELVIASEGTLDLSTPFSTHSVSKTCTGLLALRLIEEGVIEESVLNAPIQLDPAVTQRIAKQLPKVSERLSESNLIDVMFHQSGLDDYLGNYQTAIQDRLDQGLPPPKVVTSEDLIDFAEDTVFKKGDFHYSNLGLLLVGLSLQHHVSMKKKTQVTFEEALREYVLEPAKIDVFSPTRPENGKFNPDDPVAAHIFASPGGGHWSTATDLVKLGNWVGKKSDTSPEGEGRFRQLLDQYGGEFYNSGNLWHAGAIPTASAHLTHLGEQQLTVAVLSTTARFCEATAVAETVQDHLIT